MTAATDYIPQIRLYTDHALSSQAVIELSAEHQHYLHKVLRLSDGDAVLVFNGQDGEWAAQIHGRNFLKIVRQTRGQPEYGDIWLLFAPLKKDSTDFVLQKSTELGVAVICPVYTERTNSRRFNAERARANVIEAAEQSCRLNIPDIRPDMDLWEALQNWDHNRILIYGDEMGNAAALADVLNHANTRKMAFLCGPEGGFSAAEQIRLREYPFIRPAHLGPRILRAETAALAMLACCQSQCGDWQNPPQH